VSFLLGSVHGRVFVCQKAWSFKDGQRPEFQDSTVASNYSNYLHMVFDFYFSPKQPIVAARTGYNTGQDLMIHVTEEYSMNPGDLLFLTIPATLAALKLALLALTVVFAAASLFQPQRLPASRVNVPANSSKRSLSGRC
jgi:hypothetical protein